MKLVEYIKKDIARYEYKKEFIRVTEIFFRPLKGFINLFRCVNENKFEKMIKLMDAIEDIKVNENNDIMLEFKNSVVIKSNGHQIYYTKEGRIISSASMISDNPEFNVNQYIDKLDINALAKKDNDLYVFYMTKYIDFSKFTFREKRI